MERTLVLALGLMVVPAVASAQLEVGLDGGLSYEKFDGASDANINFKVPTGGVRLGFAAGETLIVETRLGLEWFKLGDYSSTSLDLMPGVNFLVGEQFYVRGEAGLQRFSDSDDDSFFRYLFGAGAGIRKPLGEGALLRLEAGVVKALENTDDGIPSSLDIHASVGVSAIIGG